MRTFGRFKTEIISCIIMFVALIIIARFIIQDEHWLSFSIKWSVFWLFGSIAAVLARSPKLTKEHIMLIRISLIVVLLVSTVYLINNYIIYKYIRDILYPFLCSFALNLKTTD